MRISGLWLCCRQYLIRLYASLMRNKDGDCIEKPRSNLSEGKNGRYYANREAQNGADKDLSRCVWVLLDFIDQVEYHTVGEFPAAILCFANGELYEIVPIPQGKETMICQLLRRPQKDTGKRIVVVEDTSQIELLDIPQAAGFCTVAEDGAVSYYKKEAALES